MRRITIGVLLLAVIAWACQSKREEVPLYVGTYSVEKSEGIYRYLFDQESGELSYTGVTPNQENPSFITISSKSKNLYAVSELDVFNHLDSGSVTAYKIEKDGSLTKLNQFPTLGRHPCHVTVSPDGKIVVASNYSSGSISIFKVKEDGSLEDHPQLIQHVGSGPDSTRQQGPHAHSSQFSPDGTRIISADLGIDKVLFYSWNSDKGKYVAADQPFVEMIPGSGPRHFVYTPDGRFIYVMNEMAASVSVLKRIGENYAIIQTVSSLPANFDGIQSGADIHLSSDGGFIYCSNRGLNTIAVFKRNGVTGEIMLIQNEPVQGDWPRNFALSPDGQYVLIANQKSNNITVFKRNQDNGKLSFTGKSYDIPSPVCLQFSEE